MFKSPIKDYPLHRFHYPTIETLPMIAPRLWTCFIALALLPVSIASAAEDNTDDLKRVMGRWERTFTNPAGTQFRVIKDVFENYDTVTTYDDVGNVVTAHRSDFKIEKRGPVRVFSFFNSAVTAGPDKGAQHFETNSYIYRVDDESFIEVWGMMDGDPNPVRILGWKRVKMPK